MAHAVTTTNAWGLEADQADGSSTRLPDLAVFAALPLGALELFGRVPLNEVLAVGYVLILLRRPPRHDLRIPAWAGAGLGGLLLWYVVVSVHLHTVDPRRLGHLLAGTLLALMLASGRVDIRSAARGLAAGLLVGLAVSVVMLPQSEYAGRLTGWFGDPNGAGLVLVSLSLAVVGLAEDRRLRWLMVVPLVVGSALTVSRTSWLALACALAWVLLGRWLGNALATVAVAFGIWSIRNLSYTRYFAPAFEERSGSDLLRGRIHEAGRRSIAESPIIGHGSGQQTVRVGDNDFFLHNSYLSIQHEVGIIGLGIYLVVIAVAWQCCVSLPIARRNAWLEASALAMLICAMNLTEVLLSLPGYVIVGLLVRHHLVQRAEMTAGRAAAVPAGPTGPWKRTTMSSA